MKSGFGRCPTASAADLFFPVASGYLNTSDTASTSFPPPTDEFY